VSLLRDNITETFKYILYKIQNMTSQDYIIKGIDALAGLSEKYGDRSKNAIGRRLGRAQCPITGDYFWKRDILNIPVGIDKYFMISASALSTMSPETIAEKVLHESIKQSIFNMRYEENSQNLSRKKSKKSDENIFYKPEDILSRMPEWEYLSSEGVVLYLKELESKLPTLANDNFKMYLHPPQQESNKKNKSKMSKISWLERIVSQKRAKQE
jgi:hypothetical protein